MGPAQLFSHAPSLPRHLSALLLLLSLSLSLLFFLLVITASPSVCFPFQSLARDFERVESEKKQRASKIMGAVVGGGGCWRGRKYPKLTLYYCTLNK